MVVKSDVSRRPVLVTSGGSRRGSQLLGVTSTHLSLSHDAGIASAFVVLEG